MKSMRLDRMQVHRFGQSSTIDQIAYDAAARTLSIAFHASDTYVYEDIPATLVEAFLPRPICRSVFPRADQESLQISP